MPQGHHLIACHECDLLIEMPDIADTRHELRCPRCHHRILSGHSNPVEHTVALSLTGLILLAIANAFPFLSFASQGQSHSITLYQASQELFAQGFYILAALVFCFVILMPLLYLGAILLLTAPLLFMQQFKRPLTPPTALGIFIDHLLPWTMTEVFLMGVLVALIKIVAMADIILGLSFWAYIAFTIVFIGLSGIVSRHRLWHWMEYGR
ncbi:MAG: paraquat-inducible protein A [Pseudomonadota bacterium]|nr:paraquat-inducible protein A [Pseudomonadota bacterium]